jgi:hypothetical protein
MENAPPPVVGSATPNPDEDHLRLLVVFHYVVGAIYIAFSSIFIAHVVIGIVMMANPGTFGKQPPPFPLPLMGLLCAVLGSAAILCGWSVGICTIISGQYLKRRTRRLFSIVIAAINCAFMPFGTALGVFTLMVLMRPSVRRLYGEP